ncbi:transglycosylase SLT domain-containing protein, partial [Paeniroseomonas aquatica]
RPPARLATRQAARTAPRPRAAPVRAPAATRPTAAAAAAGPAEGGDDVRPAVAQALGNAARASGADPALLLAMAWKESRLDPTARNPLSSARGLMQFTRGTWLEVVRDFGPRHGLAYQAALLSTDPRTGAISTRRPRQLNEILRLRDNPRHSAVMAAERLGRERPALAQALGRAPTAADLYMVHLLGPAGAQRFLAELALTPARPVTEAVGADSLQRNRGLFLARDTGRPLGLAQVYQSIEQLVAEQRSARPALLASLARQATGAPGQAGGTIEVADAR